MKRKSLQSMAWCVAAALCAAPALAEKPDWAGKGKSGKAEKRQRDEDRGARARHFDDRQRTVIVNYYGEQHRAGRCPPGLAKKQNGCLPPGQAKKWQLGRPLPREVIWYELPPRVLVDLGPPPPHHRFVRVAADILLIAVGTGMVIDAIEDLSRM